MSPGPDLLYLNSGCLLDLEDTLTDFQLYFPRVQASIFNLSV